jgi:hypothetical protein
LCNDKQAQVLRMAMKIVICEVHVTVSTYGSMNVDIYLKYKRFIAIIRTNFLQISLTERVLQLSAPDSK